MGRSPCCDKNGLKKGPWTPEEDQKLIDYIQKHGYGNWRTLPKNAGLQRCGKSCRLRWTNYLRPDIKRGRFSFEEEETIIQLHSILGNKWSAIAARLPGRTDNEIKNYWNTHIRKRLLRMGIDPVTHSPRLDLLDLSNIMCNSPLYSTTAGPPCSHMDMFSLQEQHTLVNPQLLRIATSLLSTQGPQNPSSTLIQDFQVDGLTTKNAHMQGNLNDPVLQINQIQSPIQNPANFEEYPANIPNFDVDQNYNQWQSHCLSLEGLVNVHDTTSLSYYGNDQAFLNPSISDNSAFQSNTSGRQSIMSFTPSVMSTPSSSPSSLNLTSSLNSMYVISNNGSTEYQTNKYYCNDMIKYESPDTLDANPFMLAQNC